MRPGGADCRPNRFGAFVYYVLGIPVAMGALYPFFGVLLSPLLAGAAMAFLSVTVVVKAGQPVRLCFTRQESSSCSEMVLFPDFNKSAGLPEGEEVAVEFTLDKASEYGFQCQMSMLRRKLIVE